MILLGLLIISGIFMINGYFAGSFYSVEGFREYVGRYGIFAPVVLGCIQMLQVVVPVIPGMVGCAAGAGMFGAKGVDKGYRYIYGQIFKYRDWFENLWNGLLDFGVTISGLV